MAGCLVLSLICIHSYVSTSKEHDLALTQHIKCKNILAPKAPVGDSHYIYSLCSSYNRDTSNHTSKEEICHVFYKKN